MELLKTLYFIHSPSHHEHGIQGFIRQWLYKHGIDFKTDKLNQIYCFDNINKPLICVHSDQVKHEPLSSIKETRKQISGNSNLGADDKNGIWILLNLLLEYPDLNFVFSTCEEAGGNIDELLFDNIDKLDFIPYCLVFDRKGSSDIVGYQNQYCSKEFEKDIAKIGKSYGFKPSVGLWSDCDSISDYINCINLSCGYYNAHTTQEYTVKKDLLNALEFGKAIIDNITKFYDVFYKIKKSYNYFHKDKDIINIYEDELFCNHCGSDLFQDDFDNGYCPYCGHITYVY